MQPTTLVQRLLNVRGVCKPKSHVEITAGMQKPVIHAHPKVGPTTHGKLGIEPVVGGLENKKPHVPPCMGEKVN